MFPAYYHRDAFSSAYHYEFGDVVEMWKNLLAPVLRRHHLSPKDFTGFQGPFTRHKEFHLRDWHW